MTASNGIRTENKIKRLAAAVALAVMAMLGISCLSPARADAAGTSDGNLVIDVPTTVPCALMADGTVVSPSEWKITTSGDAYIASASASGFPANVEWSAKTTDLAAAQTGSVRVSGTGDAASVSGPSDPASATLAGTARFEWSFSKLNAGKNSDIIAKAAGGTAVLGSVTFTFAKTEPDAFAVYSADDGSLTFYKRVAVPVAGSMFEGKTATAVYTGIEDTNFTIKCVAGFRPGGFADSTSWASYKPSIKTATVVDEGIAPKSTSCWFGPAPYITSVLESCDLAKLNAASLTSATDMFANCFELRKVTIGENWKWIGPYGYLPTPSSAHITGADGKWYDAEGNGYAPADIPSNKAMTYYASKNLLPRAAASVEGTEDTTIAPLYEEQGNGNALSVSSESDELEAGCSAKTSTDVVDATQKAVEGVPSLEEKGTKKSDMTTETVETEKPTESKPEVAGMATKEDVAAPVFEGAGKAAASRDGE